jgi:alpha-D-xyloside xylohydrolase
MNYVRYMHVKILNLGHVCRRVISLSIMMAITIASVWQARADIVLQDGSTAITSAAGNAITIPSFSVTSETNSVLVVLLEDKGTGHNNAEPATLSWGGQIIIRAVAQDNPLTLGGSVRGESIYYLHNPIPGTHAITATLTATASSIAITAYTLNGVDTNVAPTVGSVGDAAASVSINLSNMVAGSCAAFNSTWAASNPNPTITGTGGTTTMASLLVVDSQTTVMSAGYISGLSVGIDTFAASWTAAGQKNNFAVAVFAPVPSPINIAAASALPNPVLVKSPILLSVTTVSTAGSITNVVANASAVGGSSSVPLILLTGNVYTNSVTVTIPSASAILPVTIQDSASNVSVLNIPVIVENVSIALHDGSTAATEVNGSTVSQSLAVTAGASVLVVLVEDKGASAVNSEPATLAWGSQTIHQAVAQDNPASTLRGESIYYLFNPTPGTNTIMVTVANSPDNVAMTAYTLSGVDTTIAPMAGSGGDSTSGITFDVPGIADGSCAAFNATWASSSPNPIVTGTGGTTAMTSIVTADALPTVMSVGYISGLSAGTDTFAASWAATGQKNNFAVTVFSPLPSAIYIAAASASPNPVMIGSPVSLSVTTASTAASIASVVVNASAIGGSSALPLNLSDGNVYTNSATATLSSIGASLPVTIQDNANNVFMGSIAITVESTNVVESDLLRLILYASPFSFSIIEKATGTVLLQQTANQFTIGGTYSVSQATNFVITSTNLNADLVLAGTPAIGHISFNFVQPGMIQTTLSSSNNIPSQIFQQFADQGEDIFGGFECPFSGTLSTRNFSRALASSVGVGGIVNFSSAKAPFYLTTRHYGIYAQTDALGTLTFAQGGSTSFSFNVPQLTYDIIYGTDYATIMAGYNSLAGGSYMPPTWAFDPFWWKDDDHANLPAGVTNAQGSVLDTANKLAQYQIHASAEWIDRPYGSSCGQGDGGWGNMDWDNSATGFNNPAQMLATLQTKGLNLMLWISDLAWCDLYNEALADNYLFYANNNSTVNLQNTNAFTWFQNKLNNYVNIGIKGYKIDRGDQSEMPDSVNNRNDTLFQQLAMQGVDAVYPNDGFVFSRCASDTGRRYSALWAGDSYCTFTGLQYAVIEGLRAGIINFPMWGSDTGGYLTSDGSNIPTEELFDRWFEFSAYCPMMEVLHGGGRTPWYNFSTNFNSPTNIVAIAAAECATHHDLIPYSRSTLYQATQTGMPVMRPIMFGYPNDTNQASTIMNCEYLFGPNLLAAPVITAGATNRVVYLPTDNWLDYNTKSNLYAGPANLTVLAPIQTIPVFVREGSIIPRGDILQGDNTWTTNWSPTLRIEFFPSDKFDSAFPYYTGNSVQTISCANQNQSRVIQFGDLGNPGALQIYVKNPGSIICNGTKLNLGTDYSYNPTNNLLQIPFTGATTVVVNNSTSIFNTLWPSSSHITSIRLNGTGLFLSVTNGTPGGSWTLLQSTNVALPLSQWQTNVTGTFDGNGNLSANLANTATNLQQFYILKVQ